MASHRSDPPNESTVDDYPVGTNVEVHAFGYWYTGTITSVGRTRVRARFTTGSGATREKALAPGSGLLRKRDA